MKLANMYPYYSKEGFWTSGNMDWIIYASHDGTITFGGEWLINELKSSWGDWKSHIAWDTKN